MKNNVLIIYWILPITIISCILCFVAKDTIYDLALAIFGSSLLTMIVGIIGYRVERKKALEHFYLAVRKKVLYWSTYDQQDSIEKKCEYFTNYYLKDFEDLGTAYANIYFLFNQYSAKKKYITDEIFNKCLNFSRLIEEHYWHFKWYLDGTGKNKQVIQGFIDEIENEMLEVEHEGIGKFIKPKITENLMNKLENQYYIIMYGKRQYERELKIQKNTIQTDKEVTL